MDKTIKGLLIFLVAILFLCLGYYFVVNRNNSDVNDIAYRAQQSSLSFDQNDTSVEEIDLTNYVDYSGEMLQQSIDDGKVVLLYFTANWCPTCRAQEPINVSLFNSLQEDEGIVAYKIHILDNETTKEEEDLAKDYAVRLQHSFVLIDPSGEVVFTHTGPLTEDDLMTQLMEAKGDG